MTWSSLLPALCLLAMLAAPYASQAESNSDRFQFNRDIRIEAGERVGDVTCIGCSIYIRGQASGDVTAIAGSVFASPGPRSRETSLRLAAMPGSRAAPRWPAT